MAWNILDLVLGNKIIGFFKFMTVSRYSLKFILNSYAKDILWHRLQLKNFKRKNILIPDIAKQCTHNSAMILPTLPVNVSMISNKWNDPSYSKYKSSKTPMIHHETTYTHIHAHTHC